MKDPKSLPNCVQIMDTIMGTLESFYACAGRGISLSQLDKACSYNIYTVCEIMNVLWSLSKKTELIYHTYYYSPSINHTPAHLTVQSLRALITNATILQTKLLHFQMLLLVSSFYAPHY